MHFNLTITGELTPESAPMITQLLSGGAGPAIIAEPQKGSLDATPSTPGEIPPKVEPLPPEQPAEAPPEKSEDLKTWLREKGVALKKAGKVKVMRDAVASVGHEKLSDVPEEKYLALWEVLKNAG